MIRLERAVHHVATVDHVTAQLSEFNLAQLMRRGTYAARPDGYASQTIPDVIVSRHPGDLTPVEQAADVRVYGRLEPDPIGLSIVHIFGHLAEMAGIARAVDRQLQYVAHAHDQRRGRGDSLAGDCLACDRPVSGTPEDRIRSGYCEACYRAWDRLGRPDRVGFEAVRPKWQAGLSPHP